MLVVRGYQSVPKAARGSVAAIGNFDGVHRGHQALIALACRRGSERGGAPVATILFDPHPRRFFQPDAALFELTPLDVKLDLLARYGVELAVVLPFDRALASLDAVAFIEGVLVAGLGVRHIIVGYDFHFGKGRSGSPEALRLAGVTHGFGVDVMAPVTTPQLTPDVGGGAADQVVASSSGARSALREGAVDRAAAILGHWWRVEGVVTGGAKRGTGMGYPTANVLLPAATELAHGIYAARVHVDGAVHAGAAYLGTRPTFDNGQPVLETFLLDFDGDLYGRTIAVEFIARLRGDQAFATVEALTVQMAVDVAETRRQLAVLASHDPYRWPGRR